MEDLAGELPQSTAEDDPWSFARDGFIPDNSAF
jgi:hypothetical protein